MSSTEDIERRIVQIIIRDLELNINKDDILSAGRLDEMFGLDSIAILELVVGIEKEFNIKISDEYLTLETFQSVKTIAGHIRRLIRDKDNEKLH